MNGLTKSVVWVVKREAPSLLLVLHRLRAFLPSLDLGSTISNATNKVEEISNGNIDSDTDEEIEDT